MASDGFRVVHFCWYNCNKKYSDDLDAFENLDLKAINEKLYRALLASSGEHSEIAFVGISRGAEAIALLVSHPEIAKFTISKAVVISGINVTADARLAIPRKALNDRLLGQQSSTGDYTS